MWHKDIPGIAGAAEDRLDTALRRDLSAGAEVDAAVARRVLARLAARPLPAQRRIFLSRWWPDALLNGDFAPAWPRLAGLAMAGCLGIVIGLFGINVAPPDSEASVAMTGTFVDADLGPLASTPDPLTGGMP